MLDEKAWLAISIPVHLEGVDGVEVRALCGPHFKRKKIRGFARCITETARCISQHSEVGTRINHHMIHYTECCQKLFPMSSCFFFF